MAKSQVERYEQILAADPTSTVFVELAKSLITQGECARALEVCRRGLEHHPRSVAGRVLWGKALIHLNRPAEAMEQFDRAVALDRENPYAYNLIAEVLLKRGLYRSALPLLRRAAALQPNDGRVRQWLEQTQAALAGGPAPLLQGELLQEEGAAGAGPWDAPDASPFEERTVPSLQIPAELRAQMVPPGMAAPAAGRAGVVRGAAEAGAPPVLLPVDAPPVGAGAEEDVPWDLESSTAVMHKGDLLKAVAAARRPEAERAAGPAVGGAGLLGELPPPPEEAPLPARAPRPQPPAARRSALLGELPELGEPALPAGAPVLSTQATEALAKEYEQELKKELKQKLAPEGGGRSLLARHGTSLAVAAVALAALAAFAFFFVRTRQDFGGKDLKGALAEARRLVGEDTHASLQRALSTLSAAVEMDEENLEAWALTGLAQARMAAEHGGGAEARAAAREAFARSGVAEAHPALERVADTLLAEGPERAAAEEDVLAAEDEDAQLHALAGQLLLARGQPARALVRFQKALQLDPGHARSLLTLGDYYRREGDFTQALAMYERVPEAHPERVLGQAEVRLVQGQDLADALRAVAQLDGAALRPDALRVRQRLVLGRLLSAAGRHQEALDALAEAARAGSRRPEVQLALSEVRRAAGDMAGAQAAAEAALKLDPKSEAALEALGRALLGRDREREVLARLPANPEARRVMLVRGLARTRLGEWKVARAELARTAVGGRYPPEAVVALALADAAEGAPARAQEGLEKVLLATRSARADVRVALGRVYWQRGALDKARSQFEEALGEPDGGEGGCALGRLYLAQGALEQAVEPLTRAVAANGSHGEARDALGQVLLGLGRLEEGLKQFEAWQLESPGAARAHRGHAHALYLLGKLQEAQGAVGRAVKLDPSDPVAHRLEAVIRAARGEPEEAFRALQRANRLNPKDAETFCEIGRTFLRQAQPESAARAFEAALREDPRSPCGRVGRIAADALERKPSPAVARELVQVAEEAPFAWDKAFARATLARVQLARGAVKEARATAEQAVALMPVSSQAHWALGLAALRARDEARAHEALAQAAALDPANAPLRLALGDALARTDVHLARAVEEYEAFLQLQGPADEQARVRKLLPTLKQRLEAR